MSTSQGSGLGKRAGSPVRLADGEEEAASKRQEV